ncbi:hypothetical protein ABIA33_007107 [Streptacidiphilus sp. MAP12-16]|uniref:PH domain-containing protein n=1 Tax=Streptacidiphilus sp. MAP12-16 TaxID=3156300 RepID=UPI003512E0A9
MTSTSSAISPAHIGMWRPSPAARILGAAFSLFFAAVAVVAIAGAIAHADISMIWDALLFSAIAAAVGCYVGRAAIRVTPDAVIISNPFRTRTIAFSSIAAVSPGYYGVTITTRDGAAYTAMAIQKTNLSRWQGRRTRADEVTDAVCSAAGLRAPSGHRSQADH